MSSRPASRNRLIVAEVLAMALLSGALVWSFPPDVNEAHYLIKARHFQDRNFCSTDLFATSHESHWLFYATHGWMCRWLELETAAWLGRIVAWCATGTGLVFFVRSFWRTPGLSVLAGALIIILNVRLHLAGEWFVGGVEAKCYAWGFVFAGLAAWFRNRIRIAGICLGLACGFHILVGLWMVIAATFACLAERLLWPPAPPNKPAARRDRVWRVMALLLASGCFLVGFWPAVSQNPGVDQQTIMEASKVQSLWRLAHHQLATEFDRWFLFLPLVAAWLVLARANAATSERPLRRLNLVVAGTLLISLTGLACSLVASWSGPRLIGDVAARILTLYLFRTADVLVPAGCVINGIWFVGQLPRQLSAVPASLFVTFGLIALGVFGNFRQNLRDPRSRSAQHTMVLPSDHVLAQREQEAERNWIRTCRWIRGHTPADALFITPLGQQTFKWYAHRGEVASRKDMPQDAVSVLEWVRRLEQLYSFGPGCDQQDASDPWQFRLLRCQGALPFSARYLVVEQRWLDAFLMGDSLPDGWVQVYPPASARKSTFAVLKRKDGSLPGSGGNRGRP
jgi:hypothetical protein